MIRTNGEKESVRLDDDEIFILGIPAFRLF